MGRVVLDAGLVKITEIPLALVGLQVTIAVDIIGRNDLLEFCTADHSIIVTELDCPELWSRRSLKLTLRRA